MDSWLVIVTLAVIVVILALLLSRSARTQARPHENPRSEAGEPVEPTARQAGEPGAAARDELARSAGVASFGINLPWRRSRSESTRYRRR